MSLLNKTKLPYFLLGIGLFMIFGGGGSLFIAELKQDHEEVNKRQVNVKEIYNNNKIFYKNHLCYCHELFLYDIMLYLNFLLKYF